MEWISVKDGLPPTYDDVLIWPRPEFSYEVYVGFLDAEENWVAEYYDGYQDSQEKITVTHWMSLPEEPEE